MSIPLWGWLLGCWLHRPEDVCIESSRGLNGFEVRLSSGPECSEPLRLSRGEYIDFWSAGSSIWSLQANESVDVTSLTVGGLPPQITEIGPQLPVPSHAEIEVSVSPGYRYFGRFRAP
jgi:hypothetical protein